MKAVCWHGKHKIQVDSVPEPKILNPRDAVVKVSSTAICSSDLHLYDGVVPTMHHGDVLGHEFMGEVVEVGNAVRNLQVGDRVVVPYSIACGNCHFCEKQLWSLCDNSNPNAEIAEQTYGFASAGVFGYSHLFGGYAGGQAEFVRVPYADVGPLKVPVDIPDEQLLFLSDIFPSGYMAADQCDITPGDVVAVWGCGPVGQFAVRSGFLLGADRVIAIDHEIERLRMAEKSGAETIIWDDAMIDKLRDLTNGRGPDACIDAVGMESHGTSLNAKYERIKMALKKGADSCLALPQAIQACRKGGIISIPAVYAGVIDQFPIGAAFQKGLTLKMGQTHVHKYMRLLLEKVQNGEIDPSFVITHRFKLSEAPEAYKLLHKNSDECIKVILKP